VTLCKLIFITLFTSIIFVTEFALAFIPNVNLTFVLLAVLFQKIEIKYHLPFIVLYIFLQGLVWGVGLYLIPMFIAFSGFGVATNLLKHKANMLQALFIGLYAIAYSATFIPINVFILGLPLWGYIIADIPFTTVLIVNNFLTVVWLKPTLNRIKVPEACENAL
jgi:hypothetical protein